jgi:hypothetical protein
LDSLSKNEVTEFCYFALADLACFLCSAHTEDFMINRGNQPNVVVCKETCDAAYNNCRFSKNLFNTDVTNGTALCQNFFSQRGYDAIVATKATYRNCFYGVAVSFLSFLIIRSIDRLID